MRPLMPPVQTPDNLFHDGNPLTGELGTIVDAEHLNNEQAAIRDTQSELIAILTAAAMEPASTAGQLLAALNKLYAPLNDTLGALSTLVGGANKLPYFTAANAAALTALSSTGRDIIGKATVADVLTYLGLIPSGIDAARAKVNDLAPKKPVSWEWDPQQKKMVQKEWNWSPKKAESPVTTGAPPEASPLSGNTGTQRRLQSIADNTKATADNTKKVGPGDIIFKNLPRALALRGAYQEARVTPQSVPRVATPAAGGIISATAATQTPVSAPVTAPTGGAPIFNITFNDVGKRTDQELERMMRNVVRDAMASTGRINRGSFRDRD